MRKVIKTTMLILASVLIFGCSKEDNGFMGPNSEEETPVPIEESTDPGLGDITPLTGPHKTEVTINGSNFGTDISKVTVFFNEKEAIVESVTDTKIVTKVPTRAFTGAIKVMVDGTELVGPEFTYVVSGVRVSTFAGSLRGMSDGISLSARFAAPWDGVFDQEGNLYVTDRGNYRIRKITPHKEVSTFVGSTRGFEDGNATAAKFDYPTGITIDEDGNLYVTDASRHSIRKITPEGMVTTLAGNGSEGDADGVGANAQFRWPQGITYGNGYLYVADMDNSSIRKVGLDGTVTTLAGGTIGDLDGHGVNARFKYPQGIATDSQGNIYVVDSSNNKIKKITPDGMVTTIAGSSVGYEDGISGEARFNYPIGIAIDTNNTIFIGDSDNFKIRSITTEGVVNTVAGLDEGDADGLITDAKFKYPNGLVLDTDGVLYVMDKGNYKIKTIKQE
ncbi:SBBP repeat-containing protein [Spongiimicrobium sp. 3-5]|uniref:NHL domain-containing protein n=1 Tax=Spongiimicrobium sp. 3-5 TaxID=3332596 RepID=UPI003980E42E